MKVSVIMPVYKVEEYLGKCVDSILSQTLTEIEVFIVDDGSPDRCGQIADEYAQKDGRVKVIHKDNGGAPSARNAAIEQATGKYMYFMDSDDWAESDMLEKFYNMAEKYRADLLVAGFYMEYFEKGKASTYKVVPEREIYTKKEEFRKNAYKHFGNTMMAVPWNKLYRSEYILKNNLRFPEIKWDDLHFNMEVIKDVEKVCICETPYYHFFRSRPGSETTIVFDEMLFGKRKEQFLHVLEVYKHWGKIDRESEKEIYSYYLNRLIQCVQEIAGSPQIKPKDKKEKISEIVCDDLTKVAIQKAKGKSWVMNMCSIPLKLQNIWMCLTMGKMISFVKNNFTNTFYKLRAKEVHHAQ